MNSKTAVLLSILSILFVALAFLKPSITGFVPAYTNVTVGNFTSITLEVSTVNFSTMSVGQTKNTTTDDPIPFVLQNSGSVRADIKINMNAPLFSGTGSGDNTSTFQYKIDNCSATACGAAEAECFDWSNSLTDWTNFTISEVKVIDSLDYNDSKDEAEIDLKIVVPNDEPQGAKSSQITFTGYVES